MVGGGQPFAFCPQKMPQMRVATKGVRPFSVRAAGGQYVLPDHGRYGQVVRPARLEEFELNPHQNPSRDRDWSVGVPLLSSPKFSFFFFIEFPEFPEIVELMKLFSIFLNHRINEIFSVFFHCSEIRGFYRDLLKSIPTMKQRFRLVIPNDVVRQNIRKRFEQGPKLTVCCPLCPNRRLTDDLQEEIFVKFVCIVSRTLTKFLFLKTKQMPNKCLFLRIKCQSSCNDLHIPKLSYASIGLRPPLRTASWPKGWQRARFSFFPDFFVECVATSVFFFLIFRSTLPPSTLQVDCGRWYCFCCVQGDRAKI